MDKENFIFRPSLDPLKSVAINDVFCSHEILDKKAKAMIGVVTLVEEREKLIEQFRKYKERNKAE